MTDRNGELSGAMAGPCMWTIYEVAIGRSVVGEEASQLRRVGSALGSDEREALARARSLGVLDRRRTHAVIRDSDLHIFNRAGERQAPRAR